ncbi:MAG: pyridine nucleotide-disulfide oxidoreductase, partial [Pseudomonadales bacterium]|nr:pyridine nucleotide-disulfide oxidoreductase [Pseudomonadales bacterium]
VQNAVDQAKIAAATLCGKPKTYHALPWFWSDQYDLKLQIAGLSQGHDEVVIRGNIESSRSFAVFYLKQGFVIAV